VSFITAMSLLGRLGTGSEQGAATIVLAAVAGAALGFLRHNLPPSRIIMGDSGAYFFGFVLAATSILGGLKITTAFSLFPTVLFLFLPLLDTIVVILRRLLKRKNPISSPGKDHSITGSWRAGSRRAAPSSCCSDHPGGEHPRHGVQGMSVLSSSSPTRASWCSSRS